MTKDNVTVTKAAHVKRFGLDSRFKTMQSDLGGVLGQSQPLPLLDHPMSFDQDAIDSSAAAACALRDRGLR